MNNSEESVNNAKNGAEVSYDFMCGKDKSGDRNEASGVRSEADPARPGSRSGTKKSEADPFPRCGATAPTLPRCEATAPSSPAGATQTPAMPVADRRAGADPTNDKFPCFDPFLKVIRDLTPVLKNFGI